MLFLLNKPDAAALQAVNALAGDDDKELLLFSDGVYLARESAWLSEESVFDEIYADVDALAARGLAAGAHCRPLDMPGIVDLVLEHGKIMSL
ncbi:DsrH/TusB family sulfur metabolism protein [Desulfocurvus sp. DL9XJH121]